VSQGLLQGFRRTGGRQKNERSEKNSGNANRQFACESAHLSVLQIEEGATWRKQERCFLLSLDAGGGGTPRTKKKEAKKKKNKTGFHLEKSVELGSE